jgi:hypothetical protein
MKNRKIILFNGRWQAYEDTQVMVSNRDGKDCQIFCRASDVKIRDNVWEHNIVSTIEVLTEEADGIKFHYGPIHKEN